MNWNFFKKEKRDFQVSDPTIAGGTILDWLKSSQWGALNISTFFQGVDLISSSIAQLPIYTKKKDGKGMTNILKNHPTNLLWNDPDNLQGKSTMIKSVVWDVIVKGNGYIYINRASDGTPINLRYLPANDVTTYYTKERNELHYNCSYILNGRNITPSDMLHFKMWSWDGIRGVSLLTFAQHSINIANAANEQAKDFFEGGCSSARGLLKVQSTLSDKQRQQILNTWNSSYTNGKSSLVVIQGNMDYTPLDQNPDDSQLLESRQFDQADVCHFLNLNPAQLGIKDYSTYSSFEDSQNELLQRTLMPYVTMLENEFSKKLLKVEEKRNMKVVLDTTSYLRPNKASQSSYYTSLVNGGILSINEVRRELGYPEIEGCDVPIIPYTKIQDNQVTNSNNQIEDGNKEDNQ